MYDDGKRTKRTLKWVDVEQVLDVAKRYAYESYQHGRFRGKAQAVKAALEAGGKQADDNMQYQRFQAAAREFDKLADVTEARLEELLSVGEEAVHDHA